MDKPGLTVRVRNIHVHCCTLGSRERFQTQVYQISSLWFVCSILLFHQTILLACRGVRLNQKACRNPKWQGLQTWHLMLKFFSKIVAGFHTLVSAVPEDVVDKHGISDQIQICLCSYSVGLTFSSVILSDTDGLPHMDRDNMEICPGIHGPGDWS